MGGCACVCACLSLGDLKEAYSLLLGHCSLLLHVFLHQVKRSWSKLWRGKPDKIFCSLKTAKSAMSWYRSAQTKLENHSRFDTLHQIWLRMRCFAQKKANKVSRCAKLEDIKPKRLTLSCKTSYKNLANVRLYTVCWSAVCSTLRNNPFIQWLLSWICHLSNKTAQWDNNKVCNNISCSQLRRIMSVHPLTLCYYFNCGLKITHSHMLWVKLHDFVDQGHLIRNVVVV